MKIYYALLVFVLAMSTASAQKSIEGLWKGTMTIGGINSGKEVKFELFLEIKGKKLKGRSYVHIAPGKVIEMDVKGRMYVDQSLFLHEIEFIPTEDENFQAPFSRKYQLTYHRSFDSTLNGFWQEIITSPFDEYRERGRITLKKVDGSKA